MFVNRFYPWSLRLSDNKCAFGLLDQGAAVLLPSVLRKRCVRLRFNPTRRGHVPDSGCAVSGCHDL